MKSRLFLTALVLSLFLISCSDKREMNDETARKELIDTRANELVESENPEIVDHFINLDETLKELDKSLQGEAGRFTQGIEETNIKLMETNEMLRELRQNLIKQADVLETLRLHTIDPVVAAAMDRQDSDAAAMDRQDSDAAAMVGYEADKEEGQP